MGSIQIPRSEGLRGTAGGAWAWASMVAGSRWMARASREAAAWLLSSTDASSVAVSASVLHTVTVTLSPGEGEGEGGSTLPRRFPWKLKICQHLRKPLKSG